VGLVQIHWAAAPARRRWRPRGGDYWIYVVVNCKSSAERHLIQDPPCKLNPKEEVSVVRYMVRQDDRKGAAER